MTVRIAFIGCGDIATLHAMAVNKCDACELVGLWNYKVQDVSASGSVIDARERANEFKCKWFESLEEMLADPSIHAVYVLTPFESHHLYARMALEAGKHVLVEKPVAPLESEMHDLEEFAKKQGLFCVPGHNYIYDPQIENMRRMIESGELGQLVQVAIFYNIQHTSDVTARLPGIIDQIMTHHAYTCLFLTEEKPEAVSCMTAKINNGHVPHENVANCMLKMRSGAMCLLQASFACDDHTTEPWSFYIKVLGTQGAARYSYNDSVVNHKHTIHSHTYVAFPRTIDHLTSYFVRECILKGRKALSSLKHAAIASHILSACKESAAENKHVFFT